MKSKYYEKAERAFLRNQVERWAKLASEENVPRLVRETRRMLAESYAAELAREGSK